MGLFDSVYISCKCGNALEFQSKANDPVMNTYDISSVPLRIAHDLNDSTIACEKCATRYTLKWDDSPPDNVAMRFETDRGTACLHCDGRGVVCRLNDQGAVIINDQQEPVYYPCPRCRRSGKQTLTNYFKTEDEDPKRMDCIKCNGTGEITRGIGSADFNYTCNICLGRKKIYFY